MLFNLSDVLSSHNNSPRDIETFGLSNYKICLMSGGDKKVALVSQHFIKHKKHSYWNFGQHCQFGSALHPIIISMEFHCLRLTPGQEIKGALTEFVKKKKLRSAFIVTCCGSVRSATLRYAEKPDGAEKKVLTIVVWQLIGWYTINWWTTYTT